MTFISPSEYGAFRPAGLAPPQQGWLRSPAPLMRFFAPPASLLGASTQRGFASAATFRPRRFSRPRRLSPLRTLPGSPRVPLMGFLPYRVTPVPPCDPAVTGGPSPHDLASAAPAVASSCLSGPPSSEELFDLTTSVDLQGVSRRVDRIRLLSVSRPQGPTPSWVFLLGTSLPVADQVSSSASGCPAASVSTPPPSPSEDSRVAPSHGRPFGPVTIPD
jgi:hypothetical protein